MEDAKELAPRSLERFDFGLVTPKLEGLFFNLDRELQKRTGQALQRPDIDADRCLSLLRMFLRFAWNSYRAVAYLAADIPEDERRKPTYVLVVPNINRQLLDILFSLVYMLDDLRARSLDYQRAGWRDFYDERQVFQADFANDPAWRAHLDAMDGMLSQLAPLLKISSQEQQSPELVPYWPTPFKLAKRASKEQMGCSPFLKYLEKWLYRDTSAQAHMTFAGLFQVALFLIADVVGEDAARKANDVPLKLFHFQQVSRTTLLFLAVATEIDTYCRFGNRETVDYLWAAFAGYAPEAEEMWKMRYQNRSH